MSLLSDCEEILASGRNRFDDKIISYRFSLGGNVEESGVPEKSGSAILKLSD